MDQELLKLSKFSLFDLVMHYQLEATFGSVEILCLQHFSPLIIRNFSFYHCLQLVAKHSSLLDKTQFYLSSCRLCKIDHLLSWGLRAVLLFQPLTYLLLFD
jgi:hypothetical protein